MNFASIALCAGLMGACTLPVRAAEPESPPPAGDKIEGAVGLVLSYEPTFSGSSEFRVKPHLAGFLRYGRITVSGAGGFTTKRQDDVERGLNAELLRRQNLRVDLALRFDGGRKQSDSALLDGMGDIRSTLRARLGLRWDVAPRWQVSAATSFDALNRVGGFVVDLGLSHTLPIDPRQRLILGVAATAASERYLQAWYGVTPAQSLASGYPVFSAREGLRGVSAGATWRIEIDPQWAAFAGGSTSCLLGSAAASPLTRQRAGWSLSAGVARRF